MAQKKNHFLTTGDIIVDGGDVVNQMLKHLMAGRCFVFSLLIFLHLFEFPFKGSKALLIEYLKLCMITQIKCFFATAHMGRAQKQLRQPTRCSLHLSAKINSKCFS